MAKAKTAGLKRSSPVRGGRSDTRTDKYAAGWLASPGEPEEELIRLGGYAWSELFIGVHSNRIYKKIKNTGEWFRFAIISQNEARAKLD